MSTTISRDPFAREELHREREYQFGSTTCAYCGNVNRTRHGRTFLYRYFIETDGGSKHELRGLFCSISCLRSYQ